MNHHSESLPSKGSSSKANLQSEVIPQKKKRSLQQRRSRAAWILIAPALILLASVAGWPLLRTLFYSFTDAALDTPDVYNMVGFDNYLSWVDGESFGVLADPLWWKAVLNTLWFTGISVSFELFFGMLLALLMNQKFRGQGLVRAAILVPWAIPTIVTAKMWGWMLHDQFGVINAILQGWGLIDAKVAWTADPQYALWTVVVVDVWKTTPFMALLILAALQTLQTPYQKLELLQTPQFGKVLRLDDCFMTSEGEEFFYHEALVHPALQSLPWARRAARPWRPGPTCATRSRAARRRSSTPGRRTVSAGMPPSRGPA